MDESTRAVLERRASRTAEALTRNRMEVIRVKGAAEILEAVKGLLREGDVVANGGSMTLEEAGVLDWVRGGKFQFLDRQGKSGPELEEVFRRSFFADVYLTGVNAITERGELYFVDGNSNRVAAVAYGPKMVVVVAGINKVVRNLEEAQTRVKSLAAPANAMRLSCSTPCQRQGVCAGVEGGMTDGCSSPQRICCNYLVCGPQRVPGRIKVILAEEPLGY